MASNKFRLVKEVKELETSEQIIAFEHYGETRDALYSVGKPEWRTLAGST